MSDLHELVDTESVGRLFAILAIALPPCGILAGWLVGRIRGTSRRSTTIGLLVGLLGPANWLLWRVYNAITDRIGLDTVRNLLTNLALFIIVGAAIGLIVGRMLRPSTDAGTNDTERIGPPPTEDSGTA